MRPRPAACAAVAGILAAALFAGCAGTPDADPTTTDVPPPAVRAPLRPDDQAIRFSLPVVLGDVPVASEPSIAAAPDGAVYVTTPASSLRSAIFPPSPPLWRSDDGGTAYTFLGEPSCALDLPQCPDELADDGDADMEGPGDAEIAVTPDGVLHWAGLVGADGGVPYQRSTDRGATWSPAAALDPDSADREWLTVRPSDGALFASWRFGEGDAITVRVSYDSGLTWGDSLEVGPDGTAGPTAVHPGGGLVLLPHFGLQGVQVGRSTDDGRTWSLHPVAAGAPRGHIFPVAAIDSAGTAYVVWAEERDRAVPGVERSLDAPAAWLAVSRDGGRTWAEPRQLNAPGSTAIFPWIAAGGPGRVAVAWYENALGTPLRVGGPWHVVAAVGLDADAASPTFTAAQVTVQPVRVGGICTDGGGCTTSAGDRSLLDFFEIDLHPGGYPVLAWAQDGDRPRVRVDVAAARMTDGPDLLAGSPVWE